MHTPASHLVSRGLARVRQTGYPVIVRQLSVAAVAATDTSSVLHSIHDVRVLSPAQALADPVPATNLFSKATSSATSNIKLDFLHAAARLSRVVKRTPLELSARLSKEYECEVYLKREDLQVVRSYKLRGAYNKMSSLSPEELARGVVTASAGNHAQGVAYSASKLGAKAVIYMPAPTPKQKVRATQRWGGDAVEVRLTGDTFDAAAEAARAFVQQTGAVYVPPFDDPRVIEGQGTVGVEIMGDLPDVDVVLMPNGGGGLCAGVGSFIKALAPHVEVIGVEPEGAPSMTAALKAGGPVALPTIDRFVDGAAVKRVGDLTYALCARVLDDMLLVSEGAACSTILQLYQEEAIVVEPAGALSIAALEQCRERIRGKKVVCVVSGSNNDLDRLAEIKERALQWQGLKHHFLISFAQRPGALRDFLNNVLGPGDDITRFEFLQKNNKESGPALVGIELAHKADHDKLLGKMRAHGMEFTELRRGDLLHGFLV